jgi:hypothetical protein
MWNQILGAPCAVLLAAGLAPAQEISGPVSGFVYDGQSKAVRLIVGIPGAAYLGGALASQLDGASVSPDGRRAVIARDGRLQLISTRGDAPVELGAWEGELSMAAWSGDGNAVAVNGSRLALFRGLENSPEAVAASAPGDVKALAVAGRGDALVVATAEGLYRTGDRVERIASIEGVTALAANAAGDRVYAAAGKQVYEIGGLSGSAAVALVVSEAAGLDVPAALGVAPDGSALYIADAGTRKLYALRIGAGEMLFEVPLEFEPAAMKPLQGGRFQITAREGLASLEIFDPARQAVFFVPPSAAEAQAVTGEE